MMEFSIIVLLIFSFMKIYTQGVVLNKKPEEFNNIHIECDEKNYKKVVYDGIVPEKDNTPWLGLLRVYLSEYENSHLAVTGIVLVKHNYAIGNADDIGRIPEKLLRTKSNAVFTPAKKGKVSFKIGRTFVHKDYKNGVQNTIAIIELKEYKYSLSNIKPICLIDTDLNYHSNNVLHMFGYTDEGGRLKQEVHQILQVDKVICQKYYKQNLDLKNRWPSHYYCCEELFRNESNVCIYDNGMALVSQHLKGREKIWTLLGISARGPGCSAPSRFINIIPYMRWIVSVLGKDERRPKGDSEIFDVKDIPRSGLRTEDEENEYYKIVDFDRLSPNRLVVFIFNDTYEMHKNKSCSRRGKKLIYRENTTIETIPGKMGFGVYKISLYDLLHKGFTCINIKLDVAERSVALLYYSIGLDPEEDIEYDLTDQRYVLDTRNYTAIVFLNVFVRFIFNGTAELKLEFFGPRSKKKLEIHPDYLVNLLEDKYWNDFIKKNKLSYYGPTTGSTRPTGSTSPTSPDGSSSPTSPDGSSSPTSPDGSRSPTSPDGSRSPTSPDGSSSPNSPTSPDSPSTPT